MEEKDIPVLFGDLVSISVPLPDAACKGKSTDLFFSHSHWILRRAKQVCYGCPERIKCLDFALENKEDSGVWGGVIFRRGRPDQKDIDYVRGLGDPEILRQQIREEEERQKKEEKRKKKMQAEQESISASSFKFIEIRKHNTELNSDISTGEERKSGLERYPITPYKSKNFKPKTK
jgi:WhiB family redox-sensing transcriptional regulator